MRSKRYAVVLISAIALFTSACASSKDTGFPEPSPTPTEASPSPSVAPTGPVELNGPIDVAAGNVFLPRVAIVKVGTEVTWHQSDTSQPHTVTSDDSKLFDSHPDCKALTDPCMQANDEFPYTFTKAGEYGYYCRLHGAPGGQLMAGTVIVEA